MKTINWKILVRSILKNKTFSAISILGLTLGFTAFIIISLYIRYEFSWDKSHENYDRIYRVQRHFTNTSFSTDGNNISPHTHSLTASMIEKFPDFEEVSVIRENNGQYLSTVPEQQFYFERGIAADRNFFNIFSYKFTEGTPKDALKDPFTVVLSQSVARKFFKNEPAVGKNIVLEKKYNLKITGVFEDLPKNSSVRPDYIISFKTLERTNNIVRDKSWSGDCMTYVMLNEGVNASESEAKIRNLFTVFEHTKHDELELCPLSKIFLSFNGKNDYYIMLLVFALIGIFILLMSAFNYINYTISKTSVRAKEVAIRKINGVTKTSLIKQFLSETLILTFISALLAISVTKLILPVYNSIVNSAITLDIFKEWDITLILFFMSVGVGLLSGIYPALILSGFKITTLIKGGFIKSGKRKVNARRSLVTLQFTIAVFLICISLFFVAQINYMTNKELGFEKDEIIYAKLNTDTKRENFEDLRKRILVNPELVDASMSENLPFVNFGGGTINWEGAAPDEEITYLPNKVTYDFVHNMGISVIQGRDFSRDFPSDTNKSCLINETALHYFGWEDPIGKRINNNQWTIVGVVEDYHLKDMHNKIEPVVLLLGSGEISGESTFAFRYKRGELEKAKQILAAEFNRIFPNDPFEFKQLNTAFLSENTYLIYQMMKKSIIFFTVFSIFLAIIGLLGTVSYMTQRRKKEIGIRKINGSPVAGIFYLLNFEFIKMLSVAILIAWPVAYAIYGKLPGSYKIDPQVWIPIASLLIIILVILLTTGYQTYKAATKNPIETLRYE